MKNAVELSAESGSRTDLLRPLCPKIQIKAGGELEKNFWEEAWKSRQWVKRFGKIFQGVKEKSQRGQGVIPVLALLQEQGWAAAGPWTARAGDLEGRSGCQGWVRAGWGAQELRAEQALGWRGTGNSLWERSQGIAWAKNSRIQTGLGWKRPSSSSHPTPSIIPGYSNLTLGNSRDPQLLWASPLSQGRINS